MNGVFEGLIEQYPYDAPIRTGSSNRRDGFLLLEGPVLPAVDIGLVDKGKYKNEGRMFENLRTSIQLLCFTALSMTSNR